MQNKNILRIVIATACILLIPLLGNAPWSAADYIIAGTLLLGTGLAYEFVSRKAGHTAYRVAVGLGLAAMLLLIWMNGAVGIIGSENNPANLLYAAIPAILIIGAIIARLRPLGMSRALFTAALAQTLIAVLAFILWNPQITSWGAAGVLGVFLLNAFFALLFAGSAFLFRRAHPAPAK